MAEPTPGRIENMVDDIIAGRLSDGQLDESEITFKDISRIGDSFVRTLTSMLHARIEYPEPATAEAKKAVGNGSNNKELPTAAGGSKKTEQGRSEVTTG